MDAIELNIFASRLDAVCDEMGAVLQRAAFSPNIRDRLDFSCAVFDAQARMVAQAAHIPVHLGSLGLCVRSLTARRTLAPGETYQWRTVVRHPKITMRGDHLRVTVK